MVEVRNQARVHLWFEAKFGEAYGPLSSTAEALERFASATFAVGVRLESDDRLHVVAPFGLADLFALRLCPNPRRKTVGFARDSADVRRRWPEVVVDEGPQASCGAAAAATNSDGLVDPEAPSMRTLPVKFKRANPVDKEVIQRISAAIEKGEVWILEVEGEPTGVAVLEERADHLLIYSNALCLCFR
jgi:Nucleotidyltransferase